MSIALCIAVSLLYLGAWVGLWRAYLRERDPQEMPATSTGAVVVLGLALHGWILFTDTFANTSWNLGFFNAVSLTTWVITALLVLATLSRPVASLGLLVLPVAAIAVVAAQAFAVERYLSPDAGAGVRTHVITSVLAASVLTIAACQALALYLQERRLRDRRPGRITRALPPLQLQENLLVQMLSGGFFFLSLSLATGIVFVQDLLGQHLAHKTALASVAWVAFAIVLWGRWRHGWRGRTLIRWSVGGFTVLMLAYFGSKLILEVVLGRAWTVA